MDDIKVKQQSFSDWRNDFHPTEIESIDIIKNEPLVNEKYKYIGPGKGRKARDEDMTKHKGEKLGANYLIPQASINKKKETVAASHEVEGELVDEGLIKGAIEGGKLLYKIGKWAIPRAGRALKNKGAADIAKFKKSQEIVKRVNNIEKIRTTKALKGADVKGIFTKSKVKPGLNKVNWQSTIPVVSNRVSTTATRALTGGVETAKKIGSKVTKLKRQQITGKAQDILDKMKKGRTLQTRMDKAVSTSNKPGTLSQRTNEIIAQIKADKGSAIVKSQKGNLTTQKSRALTRIQQKSSAISNRTQSPTNITTTRGPSASNATVDVKATTVNPKSLSSSSSPSSSPSQSYSAKREYAKGWMAYNKAAAATLKADKTSKIANVAGSGLVGLTVGGKVGQELGKSKETPKVTPEVKKETPKVVEKETPKVVEKETPKVVEKETPKVTPDTKNPPNENKTIIDTEKKKVDPKKNEIVTKDKSSTGDSEKSTWLHNTRNSPAARSGAFTDDQRWETQKKHRKWKADRKKKKEVSEGVATAVKVASKIPWDKVAGAAMTAIGGVGVLKTTRKDALPDGDIPADIKKQMEDDDSIENSANIPGVNIGRPDVEKHMGTKEKPKAMKDKYDKDALKNSDKDQEIGTASELKGVKRVEELLRIARKYSKKKDKK